MYSAVCTTCCCSLHQWINISYISSILITFKSEEHLRFLADPAQQRKQNQILPLQQWTKRCNSFSLHYWVSSNWSDVETRWWEDPGGLYMWPCLGTDSWSYEKTVGRKMNFCVSPLLFFLAALSSFPCYFLFSFLTVFPLLQIIWPRVTEPKIFRYSVEESPCIKFDSCIKLLRNCMQLKSLESP